jgi:hypothetical protein
MRNVSVDELNVCSTLPATFGVILNIERQLLTILERVEHARGESAVVKENLLIRLCSNESKSAITD